MHWHTINTRYIVDGLIFASCFIALWVSFPPLGVCGLTHDAGGGQLLLVGGVMNSLSDLWSLNHDLVFLLKTWQVNMSHHMKLFVPKWDIYIVPPENYISNNDYIKIELTCSGQNSLVSCFLGRFMENVWYNCKMMYTYWVMIFFPKSYSAFWQQSLI